MKKFFGVLCLLLGLFGVVIGSFGLASTQAKSQSLKGQVQNEFDERYTSNREGDLAIGGAIASVGVIFYFIGIVLLVTKSKKQRIMEAELELLKSKLTISIHPSHQEDTISKLEKLRVLKENGTLNEAEFENQKKKILG